MIAELVTYDAGRLSDHRVEHVERRHDALSVRVTLAEYDGGTYPRVSLATPSCWSSIGLRDDGPVRLEVFDDDAHNARSSAVYPPGKRWLRTTVDEELYRTIDEFVTYESMDYNTVGDVVREALNRFVDAEVLVDG